MADELNFTNREELEDWLKDQPVEWAQVIAARAALRVLPLVGQVFQSEKLSRLEQDQLILSTYRACFVSSVACKHPEDDVTVAAYSAFRTAASTTLALEEIFGHIDHFIARAAATSSALSAAAAASPADAISRATKAAEATTTAIFCAEPAFYVKIWEAISQDTNWLEKQEGDAAKKAWIIAGSPLWRKGEPKWARSERQNLNQILVQNFDHHIVWINWYNNVLTGKSFFGLLPIQEKALALRIVYQYEKFWEQDFAKVSEVISGWLDEARIEDAAEAAQQRLDEEGVDHSETSTGAVGKSELTKGNGTTKLSIAQVDQNLVQILTSVEAIKESTAGRIANRPLKPNSGEALDNWNAEQGFLELVEEKSGQISQSLMAMEDHSDRRQAVEETATLLEELFLEFDSFVRTNKKELVDKIVRIPSAIILVGLANLVGASMITATPAIFAMVGGKKVYDLLTKKKDKSEK